MTDIHLNDSFRKRPERIIIGALRTAPRGYCGFQNEPRSLLETSALGRLEPAARSTAGVAAETDWRGCWKEGSGAGLYQAVVVNSRSMVPLNVALTISRAAPTAMKPTNARTHDPTKISERIPNTIAAIPIRISIPPVAAEPW